MAVVDDTSRWWSEQALLKKRAPAAFACPALSLKSLKAPEGESKKSFMPMAAEVTKQLAFPGLFLIAALSSRLLLEARQASPARASLLSKCNATQE